MEDLSVAWKRTWAHPDRSSIYDWASRHVEMPSVLTVHGKFDPNISRQFLGPFDALSDDRVRQVVVLKPVRGGGTLISDVWHVWARANDPGPSMVVMQSDEMAKEHAESRLMVMMVGTDAIQPLLPSDRHKQRTMEIIFADSTPLYVTGPAVRKLQSKGIRYITLDELWLYDPGTLQEAEGRLGDYLKLGISKMLIVSQAGIEDDDVDVRFNQGNQCMWHVPCLACGDYFPCEWTGLRSDGSRWGMVWDRHQTDRHEWVINKCLSSIRYECPKCGHPHIDNSKTKGEWNRLGKFLVMNPNASRENASFRWTSIISQRWDYLVDVYLQGLNALSVGIADPLIAFWQKHMTSPKSERTILEGSLDFIRQRYEVQSEWKEECIRFMTCDRQEEDLYWVTVRAWSKSGESRRLWFGRCYSEADLVAKAEEFKVSNVFIDSGYRAKGDHGVYAICARHDWVALKGEDTAIYWHSLKHGRVMRSYSPLTAGDSESGTSREGQRLCKLIRFSASSAKDRLVALIRRGKWVEPTGIENEQIEVEYRKQMSGEYKKAKVNKFTGKRELVWVCPSGNNHAFDCGAMQIVAATLADVLPDKDVKNEAELEATTT